MGRTPLFPHSLCNEPQHRALTHILTEDLAKRTDTQDMLDGGFAQIHVITGAGQG